MSIKDWYHKWQYKLKRVHIYAFVVTIMAIAGAGSSAYEAKKLTDFQDLVTNNYNRAFHESVDYVENIDTMLTKTLLVKSPSQMAMLASDIQRQALAAKSNIGQLPIYNIKIDDTAKFLSQVGDYCYMLSQKMITDEPVTDEEYEQLKALGSYATKLNESLSEVQTQVYDGSLQFGRMLQMGNTSTRQTAELTGMQTNIEGIESTFVDYPTLMYDGPFSEHIEKSEPKNAPPDADIGLDKARQQAAAFMGEEKARTLTYVGDDDGTIRSYCFEAYPDGNTKGRIINIQITKAKGDVLLMNDSKETSEETLSFEEATNIAVEFMKTRGIENMKQSYYDKNAGVATINFASVQDGVIIYPDLVKIKVALDNGEIMGFESRGYIMAHIPNRQLPRPAITEAQARAKVNQKLQITKTALAVIATDSLREVLCYEITGKFEEKNFIVYINAQSGREERILLLLESEYGVLSM